MIDIVGFIKSNDLSNLSVSAICFWAFVIGMIVGWTTHR